MAINNSTYGTELDESYDTEVVKKYRDEIDLIKRTLEEAGARGCSDAIDFELFASNYELIEIAYFLRTYDISCRIASKSSDGIDGIIACPADYMVVDNWSHYGSACYSSCGNSQPIYNTYRFREETPEKKDVPTNMNLREYYLQKMKDEMYR